MGKAIEILTKICEEHLFQEKLLFVPSFSIGRQIGEWLTKQGRGWINLRFTTPVEYARGSAGLELDAAKLRVIDPGEIPLIVESLYRTRETGLERGGYFDAACEVPGIFKCLSKSLHELRMAGIGPDGIDPGLFTIPEKGQDIAWLMEAYERFLEENLLTDHAGLLSMAIHEMKVSLKKKEPTMVMVLSDLPLSFLEKEIVRLAAGEDLIVIDHCRPAGLHLPVRFVQPDGPGSIGNSEHTTGVDLLSYVHCPEKSSSRTGSERISMFHALGESNEVREVFRRILARSIPLDDVEILVVKNDPYISLIYEIAKSLGVPVTIAGGIPVTFTRPGVALLLYLRWLVEDFRASTLMQLFSGGFLNFDRVEPGSESLSYAGAARILREAGIGWGRERYLERLESLEQSCHGKAGELGEESEVERALKFREHAERVARVSRLVGKILASVPEPGPDGTVFVHNLCAGALQFMEKFARAVTPLEQSAKSSLSEQLESLASAPPLRESLEEVAERIIAMVEQVTVGHSRPKPGHIHVANYRSGGYSSRSHTFIVGLDQGSFPSTLLQDPVILDSERRNLGRSLPLSSELQHEESYTLTKVLCSLPGSVTLSYSSRDLKEDRELLPAAVLLGVYRLITGDTEGDYRRLLEYLGEPAGFAPGNDVSPLNEMEWWLTQKAKHFSSGSVHSCYPHLLQGEKAGLKRGQSFFSEYDGWIPAAAGLFDPLKGQIVLSCSRLEALAKCPYSFFLQYLLGIEPTEDMEKDPGKWLDPLQKGEMLHEILRLFMEEITSRGERPDISKHLALLESIAGQEVEKWKTEVPPGSDFAFTREVSDTRQALQIFLTDETERCREIEPCFFELSFGMSEKGGLSEEPLEISLEGEGRFLLRGRIDRIDRCNPREYEVWDYKTGSSSGYSEESFLNSGRQLQHCLYALAAEILLRERTDREARVVRGGYFFMSPKGEGLRISKGQQSRETLFNLLKDLFNLLRSGIFPCSIDKESCRYCHYTAVCGGEEIAVPQVGEKLANDPKLEPFGRLKDYA